MGANWFYSSAYYGYRVPVPTNARSIRAYYTKIVKLIKPANNNIEVIPIYEDVHDRMEWDDSDDELISLVLGFSVSGANLMTISELAEELNKYVTSDEFKALNIPLSFDKGACVISACSECTVDDDDDDDDE